MSVYNFVEMSGRTIAGVHVGARVANADGNACFICKLPCGHFQTAQGIKLRALARAGKALNCKRCRGKRPGIIQRKRLK